MDLILPHALNCENPRDPKEQVLMSEEDDSEMPQWRHEIEVEAAIALKTKYSAELADSYAASLELNAAVEDLQESAPEYTGGNPFAIHGAFLLLSVRMFHLARAASCLYAHGHGSEARPLVRQSIELQYLLELLECDASGKRAKDWITGTFRPSVGKVMHQKVPDSARRLHDALSSDAHARGLDLSSQLVLRMSLRKSAWFPLAVESEDLNALRCLATGQRLFVEKACELRRRYEAGDDMGERVTEKQLERPEA